MAYCAIVLYKSELIYDVENIAFLTGRTKENGENQKEVSNIQANADSENRNKILRSFSSAYGSLRNQLCDYVERQDNTSTDLLMDGTTDISISMRMPSNFNTGLVDVISSAAHEYFVNTALGDWFSITSKEDADIYYNKAAANIQQIRQAINKRKRPSYVTPIA